MKEILGLALSLLAVLVSIAVLSQKPSNASLLNYTVLGEPVR